MPVLLLMLVAACGQSETDSVAIAPDIEVDSDATIIYLDSPETRYYEGVRVQIHVIPVDTDGNLIDQDIPITVTPSSGSMDTSASMELGTIRIFHYLPDEESGTVAFDVTVNGTPIHKDIRFEVLAPCSKENHSEPEFARELAQAYAPVLYQDTGRMPRADYITSFDFDGDWNAYNNWENLHLPLEAYVYYALSETRTHIFLFYQFFHPRRYGTFADNQMESFENDLSAIMLVIRKDGTPLGTLELMETMAGGQFYQYTNVAGVQPGSESLSGSFPLEDGLRPRVFLEARSHGALVSSPVIFGEYLGEPGADFRGGDGIVYHYEGEAEVPEDENDREVGYGLLSTLETLWSHRDDIGEGFPFAGGFSPAPGCTLPESFGGDNFGEEGGAVPWTFDDLDDEDVRAGEWFLHPAKAVDSHVKMPQPFSLQYIYNPYLGIF